MTAALKVSPAPTLSTTRSTALAAASTAHVSTTRPPSSRTPVSANAPRAPQAQTQVTPALPRFAAARERPASARRVAMARWQSSSRSVCLWREAASPPSRAAAFLSTHSRDTKATSAPASSVSTASGVKVGFSTSTERRHAASLALSASATMRATLPGSRPSKCSHSTGCSRTRAGSTSRLKYSAHSSRRPRREETMVREPVARLERIIEVGMPIASPCTRSCRSVLTL
mmetsp:Transcript_26431/g.88066  ORF Transcript_26431/g.88066 Transcript_26431/m.88066 type:complete len:229 (+) Transcript_26431:282-968(+)